MVENKRLEIERRLNSFKYWLYKSWVYKKEGLELIKKEGLGIEKIIDEILDPLKSNIRQEEIDKHIFGINLLKNNGNISEIQHNDFIKNLPNRKLVYTNNNREIDSNGVWDYVNKLNTNYSDIADILTELLIRSYTNGSLTSKNIIDSLLSKDSDEESKNILLKHKHKIPQLFTTYLTSPMELLNFTNNIEVNSDYGEKLENNIIKKLKSDGAELLYQGGNGDFIDMLLSVDFIIKTKKGISTIQSKSNESQLDTFIIDYNNGKHKAVDLVIYPKNSKYVIFMVKDNITKEIDK
tara:strand:- start:4474 stop:5355 length:882 start_codon:yes stop_codon:yes gene_type:complete